MRLFAIMIGLVHILSRRMLERSKEHVHRKAVPYQARMALKWVLPSRRQVLPSRRQVLVPCYQAEGRLKHARVTRPQVSDPRSAPAQATTAVHVSQVYAVSDVSWPCALSPMTLFHTRDTSAV